MYSLEERFTEALLSAKLKQCEGNEASKYQFLPHWKLETISWTSVLIKDLAA